jgi:hypothetical protein
MEKDPWELLDKPSSKVNFSSSRDTNSEYLNFWWVKDVENKIGLVANFDEEIELEINLPLMQNIELQVGPDNKSILIFLKNNELKIKFLIFCQDIIFSSTEKNHSDQQQILENIIYCFSRWAYLFEPAKKRKLSSNLLIGIVGELYLLKNFIASNSSFRDAVDAWYGPKGHEQDFGINGRLLEVKSQLSTSDNVVRINSLDQLDTISGAIWLCHIGLSPSQSETNETFSINSLIEDIISGLDGDNFGIDIFLTLLDLLGYERGIKDGDSLYTIAYLSFFEIRDDFPTITRRLLGTNAIEKATYTLNINELRNWLVDQSDVKDEVFNVIN